MQGKVEGYESINKDKIKEEIKSIDGISDIYTISMQYVPYLYLDGDIITEDYKNYRYNGLNTVNNELIEGAQIEGYSDEALNKLEVENGLKNNEVILVNSFVRYTNEGQLENVNFANIKKGNLLKQQKSSIEEYDDTFNEELNKDKKDNNFIEFKVKKNNK